MRTLDSVLDNAGLRTDRSVMKLRFSPLEMFSAFSEDPGCCLLLSSRNSIEQRYSYITLYPFMELICREKSSVLKTERGRMRSDKDVFGMLDDILERMRIPAWDESHFCSGCVGYFSYDLKNMIEKLDEKAEDDLQLPLAHLYFPRIILRHDNAEPSLWELFSTSTESTRKKTEDLIKLVKLRAQEASQTFSPEPLLAPCGELRSNFTRKSYMKAVDRVLSHIRAGDIYQACLSQRFRCVNTTGSFDLFRHMDRINPAPYSAYLNFPEINVLSSSPELFIKSTGEDLQTRPMKGTRKRGRTKKQDRLLKNELLNSPKEIAELSMIVDLERNDMGKFCEPGSIDVKKHRLIESYPTVHQSISMVTGKRASGQGLGKVIKDMFPGGSISGCPKIRAMEIIEDLEPVKRSIYTGAIGYVSFHETMQLSVAIRTILNTEKELFFQVGGGIVAGSDPEKEYQETLDKAESVFRCLGKTSPLKR